MIPSFVFADCGDPTPTSGTSNSTDTEYGAVVEITCDAGYDLTGSSVISCQADATWSDLPTCDANGMLKALFI